jgi:thiol:disulfide interchange protein/DsbC/DsbD-like thiol-disulfide interchange protein
MLRTFTFLFLSLAAFSGAIAAPVVKTEHVEAELVSEKAAWQAGKPITLGLKLRMEPQWHTYWKNPGDSGLPTKIEWVLPAGWKAGPIQWPYPHPLPVGPLMNYGYEDEVVLLTQLTPPANASPASVPVKARAEWLVCKDICIPEKGEIDTTVTLAGSDAPGNPRMEAAVARARVSLPVDAPGWKFDSSMQNRVLVVRLTPPPGASAPQKVTFFPEREGLIEPAVAQKVTRDGRGVRIEMKLADPPVAGVKMVKGVAVADDAWPNTGAKAINVSADVGSLPALAGATTGVSTGVGTSALAALLFAFIGGILLNLMPCVFPVLGIKVMGFVEHAHGEPRAMRVQGVAFTIGVLVSFIALAAIMLSLRAAGTQLGWGFQLQSPVVVMLLAMLFFVLALNLSGVFEWGAFAQSLTSSLSAKGRYADAFVSGVLASVVATPCTAPFMGAAVGFTLTQDALSALAVFTVLGFGMALPVLALSLFPRLLRFLPRPGAWMETFKQLLAFPLYATVAWLAWVLAALDGIDAVFALLMSLVLVAMAAWFYGRWAHRGGIWQPAIAILLGIVAIAVAWPGPAVAPGAEAPPKAGEMAWQPWSPEEVRRLTESGKPVFVDFTAAWCVTCQVNKRVALNNPDVVKAFAAKDLTALKADWTRQDPRITAELAALGRNAVPVYAIYPPGGGAPHLLPEVLTPSIVLDEVSRLPAGPGTAVTQR